jgi:hypothetical protein
MILGRKQRGVAKSRGFSSKMTGWKGNNSVT